MFMKNTGKKILIAFFSIVIIATANCYGQEKAIGTNQNSVADQLAIANLMNGWIHRDLGEWDALRELFHPDGIIELSWFEGKFSDFVNASMKMGESDSRSSHFIGSPIITFNGNKAIAETNVIATGENLKLGYGSAQYFRFYDMIEKRNGVWKIVKRQSVYDMGTFIFPSGVVEIDKAILDHYPHEYAPLAYMLEKSGYPVKRIFATKGSELEKSMKIEAKKWLERKDK